MTLYLDACAIVPIFVTETHSPTIVRLLSDNAPPWQVSDFAAGEVAAAFGRMAREGRLPPGRGEAALLLFDDWRSSNCEAPAFAAADIRTATRFVRRFELKLRLPDAIHAATCQRLGLTLVTLDRRLADAASVLDIGVVVPA